MAENSISWMFNPAEQAEKNQKASENIGKALVSGQVNSWDEGKTNMINNKNAPSEYVNTALFDAVSWIDAQMSKIKGYAVKHDNPMGYIASGQAYRDAVSLKTKLRGPSLEKLQHVIDVVKPGDWRIGQAYNEYGQTIAADASIGSAAGKRIEDQAKAARRATYGGLGPFTWGDKSRSTEASAIEYAAAGSEDLLLNMKDDVEKLKRAIQASYLMYLKTGNEAYVTAGGQARRLLADKMGATDEKAYKQQMDYYRTILDLSQGADAAVPDSPYVDTARYAVLKQLMQTSTDNYKKSIGAGQGGTTQSGATAKDIAEKGKKEGDA